MSKKKVELSAIKDELEQGDATIPLKFICEEKAKEIEEDIENEIKLKKEKRALQDPYRFAGYDPDAIDFIRRCDSNEQAYEIINYLEKKGEITSVEATNLRQRIEKEGIRSFGPKKEHGFYFSVDDEFEEMSSAKEQNEKEDDDEFEEEDDDEFDTEDDFQLL
ncbi:MAG: DUF2095 family protein [Candidatus Heimdallarchaeota archaeon]|nr:DUF2095 family protein [Candidatus Heimdallarchaeota archaeon]